MEIMFNKLANIEIDVPVFTVPLETIKCVKNLTTKDFMTISFMIKEDR